MGRGREGRVERGRGRIVDGPRGSALRPQPPASRIELTGRRGLFAEQGETLFVKVEERPDAVAIAIAGKVPSLCHDRSTLRRAKGTFPEVSCRSPTVPIQPIIRTFTARIQWRDTNSVVSG